MAPDPERSRRGRNSRRVGANKERATVAWLRERGWVALHNTKGPFDVMALKLGEMPMLIEVKYGAQPYNHFPPLERAQTLAAAIQAGADAYLAHWKPRASEPMLIPSSQWPQPKVD